MILEIYITQVLISLPVLWFLWFLVEEDYKTARRKAIVHSTLFSLVSFIPVIPLIIIVGYSVQMLHDTLQTWMDNDPRLEENKKKPDIIPPSQKKEEKKFKPIDDRFEIIDL